jgi:hypothetical protein
MFYNIILSFPKTKRASCACKNASFYKVSDNTFGLGRGSWSNNKLPALRQGDEVSTLSHSLRVQVSKCLFASAILILQTTHREAVSPAEVVHAGIATVEDQVPRSGTIYCTAPIVAIATHKAERPIIEVTVASHR